MSATATRVDRAAAVRRALRTMVARNGLHGASMSTVAREAGVAIGTAYVHYASKDELLLAAYLELKREMGEAAVAKVDHAAPPHERFIQLWMGIYRFLAAEPERAQFLLQVDSSPYGRLAHQRAMEIDGDPIMAMAAAPDLAAVLAPLDADVLYDLGMGPAVRLAASERRTTRRELAAIAEACWRASTVA